MSSPVRISIFEDNTSLRDTLSWMVEQETGMELAGAFPDGRNAVSHCREKKPDIILMDIDMPHVNGITATEEIKNTFPDIHILMLTVYEDSDILFDALRAGASGYLLKRSTVTEITAAILEINEGGAPMTPVMARKMLSYFAGMDKKAEKKNTYGLSEREKEILQRLVEGDSYKMIAAHLFISRNTVQVHITNVYRKLRVHSAPEAVAKALRENII